MYADRLHSRGGKCQCGCAFRTADVEWAAGRRSQEPKALMGGSVINPIQAGDPEAMKAMLRISGRTWRK